MSGLNLIYSIVFVTHFCTPVLMYNNNTLLLIISFDGFGSQYLNRNLTPTFLSLRERGSYAPYMVSVFPTLTFANHHTMATGLYPEVHGILDNKVYDKATNKVLQFGYELYHYNDNLVPLWIQNENAGGNRISGCMLWPGCSFKYQDKYPTFKYNNLLTLMKYRVNLLLSWFTDQETPANLVMAHFEQPDYTCHSYGPDTEEVNKKLTEVDDLLKYLLEKVEKAGLQTRLNIILVSDHGCVRIHEPDYMINLDKFVNNTLYKKYGEPPNVQIYPTKGKETEVLDALRAASKEKDSHFNTYSRAEIPERYHYKNCERAPPILLTADLGYLFLETPTLGPFSEIGQHGYDPNNPEMGAIFMATGPLFKKNLQIKPFENIGLFPLAAHILDLPPPAVAPNGTLSQLEDILLDKAVMS